MQAASSATMGIVDLMATDPTPLPQQPPALPRHREQPHLDTISGAWRAFEDARDRDGDWGQDTLGKQLDLAERILRLSEEQVEVRRYAEACKNLLVVDNLTDRTLPPGSLNKRRLALRATLFHCYACVRKGQGRVPDALRYAEKALSVMMSLNRLADLPQCYLNLGSLLASMGLHAEALKHSFLALQTVKVCHHHTPVPCIIALPSPSSIALSYRPIPSPSLTLSHRHTLSILHLISCSIIGVIWRDLQGFGFHCYFPGAMHVCWTVIRICQVPNAMKPCDVFGLYDWLVPQALVTTGIGVLFCIWVVHGAFIRLTATFGALYLRPSTADRWLKMAIINLQRGDHSRPPCSLVFPLCV